MTAPGGYEAAFRFRNPAADERTIDQSPWLTERLGGEAAPIDAAAPIHATATEWDPSPAGYPQSEFVNHRSA